MDIGPYSQVEKVGATACGEICTARRAPEATPVLLKVLPRGNVDEERRLRREFGLLESLTAAGLMHPRALHEDGRHLVEEFEAFACERLEETLARESRLPLANALEMGLRLARALEALHGAGVVHRDLRPANVLVALGGGQACLADASRASARSDDTAPVDPPEDGLDWAYASPEQTGRVNLGVDHRTDLYALGVLLHRILAGHLPFEARDAAQWVHAHLAFAPPRLSTLRGDIPETVSDLVQRLLSKSPEDRYQSAAGAAADLERCGAEWLEHGRVASFTLGAGDRAGELRIPQSLYGREAEVELLREAFESAAAGGAAKMVGVYGPPGIGKSALVETLRAPVAQRHGHFVAAKFDPYRHDVPYATLAQACDGMVRQVLGGSDTDIARWNRHLAEALAPNAALLAAWVPHLPLVLGPQPPVPDLPPQDAQRRFRQVLRRFLGACASERHPLVLFLDDLQWADTETMTVLVDVATDPDVRHLLIVAAWRDGGIDDRHPLAQALQAMRQAGGDVATIPLAPLAPDDVARLVGEALQCPREQALPLARHVLQKTGGNPFFARQFLAALAEERLVSFDAGDHCWRWDLPRIQAKGYADNVVDLIVRKLGRLPDDTQDALKRFACLGHQADSARFTLVFGSRAPGVHARLLPAVRLGLVWRDGENYGFLHDRVREAAYSLIAEDGREAVHLQIGRALATALAPDASPESVFEAANQYNRGSARVTSRDERIGIAELDLRAARCARAASAFASALAYFVAGSTLLPDDAWNRVPALAFALELGRAECEFLTGAPAQAQARLASLADHASTVIDRAAVACARIDLHTTLDRSSEALAVGLDYLRGLGIGWTTHPRTEDVQREYDCLEALLGDRPIEALLDLPVMTDPAALGTLDVLTRMGPPAFFTAPDLYALVVCRAVGLSLAHGNGDSSSDAYVRLGLILGDRFGDYLTGYRFGEVGIELVDRGLARSRARTWMLFAAHLLPTRRPIRSGRALLRRAFDVARQDGDATFAGCICFNLDENLLAAGDPLADVQREAERGLEFARRLQFGFVTDIVLSDLGLVRSLRGLTHAPGSFDDGQFDERAMEAHFRASPELEMAHARYRVRKMQALYLAGDAAGAVEAGGSIGHVPAIGQLLFIAAEYHFYRALALAACCGDADPGARARHVEAIARHSAELDVRARHCPENFSDRAALVRAEFARLNGDDLAAQVGYERAVEEARANGLPHTRAIALELAAQFYRERGLERLALEALRESCEGYARWGADAKVMQLRAAHPALGESAWRAWPAPPPGTGLPERARTGDEPLDLLSLAKATQAISGELELDELAGALLRIVLENAGAQVAFLLLARGDALTLAADARLEDAGIRVRSHDEQPAPEARLPMAVLNYVRRSHEPVVLQDASEPHPFMDDPRFAAEPPRSLLCLPILRQSSLLGLLYLENRFVTHAFPPRRLAVLEVLTAQAAISLENARLYDDLKSENEARKRAQETLREQQSRIRRLVESNIIGVFFWDARGGISEANEAFLRMTGYSQQDLATGALRWTQITPAEDRPADARALETLQRTGVAGAYEKEYIRKDGTRLPVLVGGALFEGSHDQGVGFVLDLTERRQAEADREARRVAEAANAAKSLFLANMSHELRTPLNGILGFAQILQQRGGLAERDRQAVAIIRRSGDHLLNLINDVLDFAKIEAGRLDLNTADVHLGALLSSTVDLVRELAERKHVALVWHPPPHLPETVRADPKRLSQVLLNLLSNGVKFTDHGRVELDVRRMPSGHVRFEVSDTGIGISPEQCATLFRPFVQLGDVHRRSGGTGLGLAIAQQLVRRMGGEIAVRSQPGEGSSFSFELEFELPAVQAAPSLPPLPRSIRGYGGPRRRILVVDDVADNRNLLTAFLGTLGFEVGEAANGQECLDIAPRLRPDLLVMDLVMPQMAGLETIPRLRALASFERVPIIIVSASATAGDAQSSLEAGADAFMPKPLDLDALVQRLGELLQLSWEDRAG